MLTAFIDLGSSATRAVYWNVYKPETLWMPPQVAVLDPDLLYRLNMSGMEAESHERAWVEWNGTYAVGAMGRLYGGGSAIAAPKRDWAIVKVLAVLGVLLERASPHDRTLNLGVLLPLEEYWNDLPALKSSLHEAVSSFSFRGNKHSCMLNRLEVVPEGAGLFFWRATQIIEAGGNPRERVFVVVMFGHRNLSVLTFERGNPPIEKNSTSAGPGFIEYLRAASKKMPGVAADDPDLFDAVLSGVSQFRITGRKETYDLEAARFQGRKTYTSAVKEFLKNHLPLKGSPEIIVCGGPLHHTEDIVEVFESLGVEPVWPWALTNDVARILEHDKRVDALRLADVYSAFLKLLSNVRG